MAMRWLFGDQLGPHFLDDTDADVLLIESTAVLRRRRVPPAEGAPGAVGDAAPGGRAGRAVHLRAVGDLPLGPGRGRPEPLEVIQPTSWAALHLVDRLADERDIERLPARGFSASRAEFTAWADGRGRQTAADGGLLPRQPAPDRAC